MKKCALISLALVILTACGGGGGGKGAPASQGIAGRIIDAPLSGSQIFVDLNKNFVLDSGEPSTVSNENGYFSLASLTSDCTIPTCNAQIVALGGKDIATGQALPKSILIFDIGLLSSPSSDVQVSPVSSAVSLMGSQADTFLALIAPGVSKSDLLGGDLWSLAAGGNSVAKSAVKKIEQIGVLMNTLAAINPSASGANVLKSVVAKLSAQASAGQNPLNNQAALEELIDGVALELGNTSLSSGVANTLSQALSKYLIAIDTGDLDPGSPAAVAISSASQLGLLQKIGKLLGKEITEQQFLDDTELATLVDSTLFNGLRDTDKDGIVDALDPDDDNDGVPDGKDAFPQNQESQLATVLRAAAVGNLDCPNGGVSVQSGIDENGNGTLDDAEVDKTDIICHGSNAISSLISMSSVPAGDLCPNGGIQIHTGPDSNNDGVLSVSEIQNTKTLCNAVNGSQGQQGAPGADSVAYLISQVAVPVGSQCQYGGTKISSGRDTDGNAQLSPSEASATSYACNGAVFAIRTKSITDANVCVNGGIQVETGIDANVSGVLDNSEVSALENICNGQDGHNALINLTTIEPGPICQNGGMQVHSGPDLNNDHILSQNEVSATKTICNAVNGSNGAAGRDGSNYIVDLSPIASGHPQCANGGARVDAGLDSNRNGALDSGEVSSSVYICNGGSDGTGSGGNTPPSVPATTNYNIAVNQALASTMAASDIDGDRISFEVARSPEHGTLTSFSSVTGDFTYQPDRNYEGADSFEYQADDGRQRSSNSRIAITVAKRPIPAGSFQVNSEALQIIDYPDGISPRTFILSGATQSSRMQADLDQPAALSALNLQALADDEPAEAPLVSAELLNLPSSNGTSKITISLFDGSDENRDIGERQVSFTYVYDWVADGTSVSVSPTPGANAEAIYFTQDGELAVSVKLKNETANIFGVLNGNQLAFTVASLFSDDQLRLQFTKRLFRQGNYFYRVEFDGFPVVDSYGVPFNSIVGKFYVSQNPVPYASSGVRSLSVREGQLTQANFALAGSGGTGTLSFAVDQLATTGTMNIDSTTGKGQFTPLAANLLVDDAIGFSVSDGFLHSNPANYRLNIVDDADINSDLSATYDVSTSMVSLAWTDNASDEAGYRVESYDITCQCWVLEENLAASEGNGLPYTWTRSVSETRYYRVFRLGYAGDELMAPGVVVANVGATPTMVLDQEQPVAGYVSVGLENTPPLVNRVDYYVDLTLQCRYGNKSWPVKSCRIYTPSIGDGEHQLRIEMEYQERSYVVMTSQFSSAQPAQPPQPNIGVSQRTYKGNTRYNTLQPGEYEVQILPSSAAGIAGIDFNLDEVAQARMTSPNSYWGYSKDYCTNISGTYRENYAPCICETDPAYYQCTQRNYDGYNAYTWQFVNPAKGTRRYDFLVEAGDGDTREGAGSFLVPLEIVLDQPVDSTINSTTLVVSGSVANTINPINITVTLGGITLLRTEGPNFYTEFDMTGLSEKDYTLRVNAVEINGSARSSTTKTLTYTP
jgi:hypothetical protein